ncbi:hypothetical protein [Winogradskyella sp.]|uniref:energy transducer TonB n=1 Tax=Winogradskyella sp. TaxID=1883156 RepID=UPI0025E63EE1|nr:hypothetical protein [Winogradskyella sp.]
MKKNIIIFCTVLTALSLTACDFSNEKEKEADQLEVLENQDLASNIEGPVIITERINSDFIFDVGPRFNVIKKTDLDKAKSFSDFIADEHAGRIVLYKKLSVIVLDGENKTDVRETANTGNSGNLTPAQIKLLQSADYSTNLLIWADYREKSFEDGQLQNSTWTPYLSVVPEKQAKYIDGKESLIAYLDKSSEAARANVESDKLKPAKIIFTVTKNGTIENAKLDRASGYPSVDKMMIELINNTPGTWEPAENIKGEKVDQALTISFGILGC